MTSKIYHILNGDALYQKWPPGIPGELIVMRECLVTGPVAADDFIEFCIIRSQFIFNEYGENNYEQQVVKEWNKIVSIEAGASVYLWFEKDLFCQVNLWFILYLLKPIHGGNLHLVVPLQDDWSGFGKLNSSELLECYQQAVTLSDDETIKIRTLWDAYTNNDFELMTILSIALKPTLPFVAKAISLHFERLDTDQKQGKPSRILNEILKTTDPGQFELVFSKFFNQAKEFGFGDLQVKSMLRRIQQENKG